MSARRQHTDNAEIRAEAATSSNRLASDDIQSWAGDAKKDRTAASIGFWQRRTLDWTVCAILAVLAAIAFGVFQPELATLKAISEPLLGKTNGQKASSEGRSPAVAICHCHKAFNSERKILYCLM